MVKLSPFSKYPTWRTSSLYTFLLMWLREPFSIPIVHRATAKVWSIPWCPCQISQLPQETCHDQTSIVGCFFCFWCQRKKSPMPSSMSTPMGNEASSPALYQPFPQHRENQESRQSSSLQMASSSLSPSHTLERCRSAPHPTYSLSQDRLPDFTSLTFSHPFLFVGSICNMTRMKNRVDLG